MAFRILRPTFRFIEAKNNWEPGLDRCIKRLAMSKAHYLFFGGRMTLVKATLSNLPIYYLSLFKIPKGVATDIENLQNKFLWRGQQDSKPHLINWKTISRGKKTWTIGFGRDS